MKLAIFCLLFIINYLISFTYAKSIKNKITLDFLEKRFNISTHFYDFSSPITHKEDFLLQKAQKALNSLEKRHSIQLYLYIVNSFPNDKLTNDFAQILSEKFKIDKSNLAIVIFSINEKKFDYYLGHQVSNALLPEEVDNFEKKVNIEIKTGGVNYAAYYFTRQLMKKIKLNDKKIENQNLRHHMKDLTDIIKTLVLLPIIVLLCYFMIFSKVKKINKKKEFLLEKLKEFKGTIKREELTEKTCVICLEEFMAKEVPQVLNESTILKVKGAYGNDKLLKLECSHTFHPMCINKWINKQKSCPTCRQPIKIKNINLYKLEE